MKDKIIHFFQRRIIIIVFLTSITIGLCIVLFFALRQSKDPFHEKDPTHGYQDSNAQNILNLFCINNAFYYICHNGDFYQIADNENIAIYTFPTNKIHWSYALGAFLFIDHNAICFFDPLTKTVTHEIEIKLKSNQQDLFCVILATRNYIYFQHNTKTWKMSLDTKHIEQVFGPVPNRLLLYYDDTYSVFQSSDYQQIYIMELNTDKIHKTAFEPIIDKPVVSACIEDHCLYYVRSDGFIRSVSITEDHHDDLKTIKTGHKIVALASYDHTLVCVAAEHKDSVLVTFVVLIDKENIIKLTTPDKPAYIVPGTCKIIVNNNEYCFAIVTDSCIRRGNIRKIIELIYPGKPMQNG